MGVGFCCLVSDFFKMEVIAPTGYAIPSVLKLPCCYYIGWLKRLTLPAEGAVADPLRLKLSCSCHELHVCLCAGITMISCGTRAQE